jgi:outer membrane protein assembly factor BamD (BamD/ComL family)
VICFQLTDTVTIFVLFAAFISQISALKIAISNFECGEYPRALMYLEMFIKENPQQFQEQLWLFMVCLNSYYVNFKTCFCYLCC